MLNNAFVYPPDIEKAKKHRRANYIFKSLRPDNLEYCQCCGKRVGQQIVETSCLLDSNKLSFLGPGVPLFFFYLKVIILMLVLMSIIFVGFALYSNYQTGDCSNLGSCTISIFTIFSLINKRSNEFYLTVQSYSSLLYVLVFIVAFQYFRFKGRQLKKQCDEVVDSPSDYAVILRRLPKSVNEQQILDLVEARRRTLAPSQLQETQNLKVVKVILSYSLREYNRTKNQNTENFKKSIKEQKYSQFKPQQMPSLKQTSSIAIIIFEHQTSKQYFIHKPSTLQRLLQFLCTPCIPISDLQIGDTKIGIERAPEPDDICWQNSGITMSGAILRKIGYGSFAVLVLLIGGAAQFGLELLYNSTTDSTWRTVLLIVNSFLVLVFNFIITLTLIITTKKERNETLTQYQNGLMVKQAIFQFFNAGIFVIGAQIAAKSSSFVIDEGICSQVTIVMITNCIIPNFTLIILNYTQMVNNLFRFLQSKEIIINTQQQLNALYLAPEIQFSSKYAFILKIIWLTGLYAPLVPIVVVFSIIGIVLNYFFEKILFTKVYSVPNTVSSMVYENALELTEYFLITFAMGQLIIYFYFYSYSIDSLPFAWLISIFACLFFGILNLALPMDAINETLFKIPESAKSMVKYSSIEQNFDVTYQMLNPAYKTIRKRKNKFDILGLGGIMQEEKSKQVAYQMTNLFNMQLQNQNKSKQPLLNPSSNLNQGGILSIFSNKQEETTQQRNTQNTVSHRINQNDEKTPLPVNAEGTKKINKINKNELKTKGLQTQRRNQNLVQSFTAESGEIKPKMMKKPKGNEQQAHNQQKAKQNPNIMQVPLKPNPNEIPLKRLQPFVPQPQQQQIPNENEKPYQFHFANIQFDDPQKQKHSRYNPHLKNSLEEEPEELSSKPSFIHKQDLSRLLGRPFSSFIKKLSTDGFPEKQKNIISKQK